MNWAYCRLCNIWRAAILCPFISPTAFVLALQVTLLFWHTFICLKQLDPIEPADYDTAGRHNVTYHMTCGVFLVSCPSRMWGPTFYGLTACQMPSMPAWRLCVNRPGWSNGPSVALGGRKSMLWHYCGRVIVDPIPIPSQPCPRMWNPIKK